MRIDDFEQVDLNNNHNTLPNPINFEQDMEEIDLLISDIQKSENTLRKRNNKYKHGDFRPKEISFRYITGSDINDIDDVVIEIETPEEYYTNKERRIIPYTNYTTIYIINIIIYLINLVLNFIIKGGKFKSL
jgi:hypothetical protein